MKTYAIFFLLAFISVLVRAQGNGPGLPGDDPDVPLDGGVGFLLAAGIAYGIKKTRELRP